MDAILLLGLAVTGFVAFNIGGATTGPAFGPATGANVISTTTASRVARRTGGRGFELVRKRRGCFAVNSALRSPDPTS